MDPVSVLPPGRLGGARRSTGSARCLPLLRVEAVGADAVRRAVEEPVRDRLVPFANRVDMEPLAADVEPVAPGAAADTDHPGFCIAKDLRQCLDACGVAAESRCLALSFDNPAR
jgi:hypothetical protein